MENEPQHSSGKEPKLTALHQIPNWKHDFFASMIKKDLMEPLIPNFVANTVQLRTKNRMVYGHCLSSLSDFPDLRDRMLKVATLDPSEPATFIPDGSLLFRRIVQEGLENAGDAYYQGILTHIHELRQGSQTFPVFITELNNLFKQLPATMMPSDALKKVILRKAIHPDLNMMATASCLKQNCTYDGLCSDLLGEHHQQLVSKKTSAAALTETTKLAAAAVSRRTYCKLRQLSRRSRRL